ncbi:MAG: nucleotide exchange factor GrpE [Dehalococcoidia bacterium]
MTQERESEATQEEPAAPKPPADEPDDVAGLRARLEEEKQKAQDYLSSWQRAAADYQNFKRRVEQERSEVGRLANAAVIFNLLPLVDDLERALRNVDTKLAGLTWIDGIWLIYRKFQNVLESAGVKEIQAEGQPFDPNVHEAISEAPGEEGKVVSVVQKGYTLGDRVIRPAMVVVGRGTPPAADGTSDETRDAGDDTTRIDAEGQA